jgi:hypothetical protein
VPLLPGPLRASLFRLPPACFFDEDLTPEVTVLLPPPVLLDGTKLSTGVEIFSSDLPSLRLVVPLLAPPSFAVFAVAGFMQAFRLSVLAPKRHVDVVT